MSRKPYKLASYILLTGASILSYTLLSLEPSNIIWFDGIAASVPVLFGWLAGILYYELEGDNL
jgi:hypothetical protein